MKIIITWVLFLGVIAVNALANILPINGYNTGQISAFYPNVFVPAGFTFSIWGLIYLLLLSYTIGFTYYSIKGQQYPKAFALIERINIYFLLTCVFNMSWIVAWHYLQIELSVLIMLLFLITLIQQRQPLIANNELEDWQISQAQSHTSDLGKSAEVEALENLPDSDIKNALQELPEEFRMAVYLADVEGFSYKEIAEIVGIPAGTVMSRLHRGRKLLREKLADYARELGYTTDAADSKGAKESKGAKDAKEDE
jgi:RNA polymerase sigma factor (sigma-70 family)